LESISETARRILDCSIRGRAWPVASVGRLVEEADTEEGSRALFGILAEGLSDRFEPRLVDAYAALFSEVIAAALPGSSAAELLARYQRVRRPRRFEGGAEAVYVLSRVTLGADVAITSLVLDAAKRCFPAARIVLVGGEKSYQLFAGDPRIEHLPVAYRRGTLRERLEACPRIEEPGAIVIDPDSRLTQLGLVPVCPEESYYFFEGRAYGADTEESLGALTRRWIAETFRIPDARAWIAPGGAVPLDRAGSPDPARADQPPPAGVAVSLGVGENPAKGMPPSFEQRLLGALADRGLEVVVDSGPGGEERERVRRAIGARQDRIRMFQGSFAAFAGIIARSRLYVGYDSAGQHAAAACGVPLATIFAGAPCPRFCARWRPTGPGPIEVIQASDRDPECMLQRVLDAVDRLLRRC
jgi:ADP-heptose:LPS heptosyltransferase